MVLSGYEVFTCLYTTDRSVEELEAVVRSSRARIESVEICIGDVRRELGHIEKAFPTSPSNLLRSVDDTTTIQVAPGHSVYEASSTILRCNIYIYIM